MVCYRRSAHPGIVAVMAGFSADVIIFVQINDVCFIDARADYADENTLLLPRIANLVKRLRRSFGRHRVIFCLPGDFLAPSCLSKHFGGSHMVAVLNKMGVDYVTIGNHELERRYTPADLLANIKRSKFKWLAANFDPADSALQAYQMLDTKLLSWDMRKLSDKSVLCIAGFAYPDDYGTYGKAFNPSPDARDIISLWDEERAQFEPHERPDFVYVALTHQNIAHDLYFAQQCPEFHLVMGGHDHHVMYSERIGRAMIVKALSNARSVRLNCAVAIPAAEVEPHLRNAVRLRTMLHNAWSVTRDQIYCSAFLGHRNPTKAKLANIDDFRRSDEFIDDRPRSLFKAGDHYLAFYSTALDTTHPEFIRLVTEDRFVRAEIDSWNQRWSRETRESSATILVSPVVLDAEDRSIRQRSTNLGNLLADIMRGGAPPVGRTTLVADMALLNSGAVRIDRKLAAGEALSQRTICDLFFYEDRISVHEVPGAAIRAALAKSLELCRAGGGEGDGEFLQISGLQATVTAAGIDNVAFVDRTGAMRPLNDARSYKVATNTYVAERAYQESFAGHPGVSVHVEDGGLATLDRLMEESLRRIAAADATNLLAGFDASRWRGPDFS
jgi:2',3'-cyclic-nucleotide 2'-phosphodiesterase (5'-nucleotidase family)